MKYYIQYYNKNLKNEIVEALGSDSIFILDGRNNLNTMIEDGKQHYRRMRNIHPNYIKFEVRQGNLRHYRVLKTVNLH